MKIVGRWSESAHPIALEDRSVAEVSATAVGGAEDSATATFESSNTGDVTTGGLATGAIMGQGVDTEGSST